MPILGIGVDVVHVPRIAAVLRRRGRAFAKRILSAEELARWDTLPLHDNCRFLATRWSVKEAAYKALYPTLRPTWKDFTYRGLGGDGEKPALLYHSNSFGQNLQHGRMQVSVSHDGEYVFSLVLVQG